MKKVNQFLIALMLFSVIFTSCKKDKDGGEKDNEEPEKELVTKVPTTTPQTLFLLIPGGTAVEMVKDGSVFATENYVSLQTGGEYAYNTKADGTGTTYMVKEPMSAYEYADDEKVAWDDPILEVVQGEGGFTVSRSQAYKLSIDFSKAELNWEYYNLFAQHYTDWGNGPDEHPHVLLQYKHPHTYEATIEFAADHYVQLNSKYWEGWLEYGPDDSHSLTGNLTRGKTPDYIQVAEAGTYKVTITLDADLETGAYTFVKQ